jgi:hypothetical protein
MNSTHPIRDEKHVIGEQAVLTLKRVLPKEWICREQSSDYGIDVEIELADKHATGWIFKGQVKGHGTISWNKDSTVLQPVRDSTLAYWRGMRVPVVLFLVDVSHEQVYWAPGQGVSVETTGIRINKADLLPQSLSELKLHLSTWIDLETSNREILSVARIAKRLAGRQEQTGYDYFMALEDDAYADLAALYEEIVSLRKAVGLPYADLFPWSLWLARVRRFFGKNAELMHWGIHDEIMLYLNPLADEAIGRAKEILRMQDVTPENSQAKYFADDYKSRTIFMTEFDEEDEAFWNHVQAELKNRGACLLSKAP